MTHEDWKTVAAVATPALVVLGRLWSMFEHRMTGKQVKQQGVDIAEIKISINGELEKRIDEAKKKWVEEQNKQS